MKIVSASMLFKNVFASRMKTVAKQSPFAMGALALVFAACGDDGSSTKGADPVDDLTSSSTVADIMADTFADLPVCVDKREGAIAYVKDEKLAYVCENGDWVADGEATSSSSHHCEDVSEGCDETISSSSKGKIKSSSSTFVYEQDSSAFVQPKIVAVKDKSISGVSQKGPFVTGSAVKLYELDGKSYSQTGKSFTGKITTDDGKFSVSSVTLASQYALLEANGYFRNEITGNKSNGPITLYALTDLSNRKTVNINLLTHLEYERALYLVGTGINVSSAKKQAEAEILNAFGIKGKFANSEDLDIFSKSDENAALLAISVLMLRDLSEADLTELLTKFATDIESDGRWDDEVTKAEIADWAKAKDLAGEYASIRGNIEKWNLGTVPDFEKYVRNFWFKGSDGDLQKDDSTDVLYKYDKAQKKWLKANRNDSTLKLKGCTTNRSGEVGKSSTDDTYYICGNMNWQKAQEIEYDTYGEKCTSKEVGKTTSGVVTATNKYYCTANGWISLMDWRWDVPKEVRLNPEINYGTMTDSRDGQTYKTVKIGGQVWMAENLNYADSIKTPSLLERSWCPYNVNEYCAVTGRLYSWAAAIDSVKLYKDLSIDCGHGKTCTLPTKVQGICPDGWHLPSLAECETLFTEVGGSSIAGKVLKSQTGWDRGGNGTDDVGFSALPDRTADLERKGGGGANFWCASENNKYFAYFMSLKYYDDAADLQKYEKYCGYSVRCLKD